MRYFSDVTRSSSDAFEENERPTARRERLDDVDLANAANKTQQLRPRDLLPPEMLDGATSGTQRVHTPPPPPEPAPSVEAPAELPPRAGQFFVRHDGRLLFTAPLLVIAIMITIVVAFAIARFV